jgi:DNA ligase (NAD+)
MWQAGYPRRSNLAGGFADYIERHLESKGAKVSGSISANTDYLLSGEGGGSKRDKAEKLGVKVIGEEELAELLG